MRRFFPCLLLSGLLTVAAGCARIAPGDPPPPPAPEAIDAPALVDGVESSAAEDRAVAELLSEAEARLARNDPRGASQIASEVEQRFPHARGASRALWVRARAEAELGSFEEAERAAAGYLSRVGPADRYVSAALLLRAEARLEGELPGGIEALFRLPLDAPEDIRDRALSRARAVARSLDDPTLRDLLDEAPRHPWLYPVFQLELGSRRSLVGDFATARSLAETALALEPAPEERERAERLLAGEPVAAPGALAGTLGAILPTEASPTVERMGEMIREGIEVALLTEEARGGIRLVAAGEDGGPRAVADAVRRLEAQGVLAVVGPLTEPGLEEALSARSGGVALLSPTARLLREGVPGAYSLTGPDPEAARTLARAALDAGVREVALLHGVDPQEEMEARWFREAYEAGGGRLARILSLPPGATSFEGVLGQVTRLAPAGLVLFLAPQEVELLAPQIAHYGVDDGDIRIIGGPSWASDAVLQNVPARHTDGVLTVAPHVGEGYGPAWSDFMNAYEAHFERTLRSPVPGLGYDAATLVLDAARREGTRPEEVARGLASLEGVDGATGTFSFRHGRIVRHYEPVRLEGQRRMPLDP